MNTSHLADTTEFEGLWTNCDRCGEKLFVHPESGQPELCANCKSLEKTTPLVTGGLFMILMIALTLGLMALGAYLVLGQFL